MVAVTALLASTPAKSTGSPYTMFIFIGLFAAIYFFFWRPRQKKRMEQTVAQKKYEVGDEIVTIGGIVGRVISEDGDRVTIETGGTDSFTPKSTLVFVKQAIAKRVDPVVPGSLDDVDHDHDHDHDHTHDDDNGRSEGSDDDFGREAGDKP